MNSLIKKKTQNIKHVIVNIKCKILACHPCQVNIYILRKLTEPLLAIQESNQIF